MKAITKPDAAPAPMALPATTPMTMIERAIEKGADVAMIEKLMELQERYDRNLGRRAFDHAVADAKAEIGPIMKNRKVDFTTPKGRTNYNFEDMAEVARTVDPVLSKHGLSYRFRATQEQRVLTVTCIVSHRDGYSEETTLCGAADDSGNKNHLQAIGSAATYLQRYSLKMALGLSSTEDDDGRSAAGEKRINADQYVALTNLLEEVGGDEAKFALFLGIPSVEEMPLARFDEAMAALRKKAQAAAKKGAA